MIGILSQAVVTRKDVKDVMMGGVMTGMIIGDAMGYTISDNE